MKVKFKIAILGCAAILHLMNWGLVSAQQLHMSYPYERYREELDRVPIPSEKAIKNTLEISHRVAPKLAGIDINRHMYFTPVQRLVAEGFIDRLYK
jgi:hypothetical protein